MSEAKVDRDTIAIDQNVHGIYQDLTTHKDIVHPDIIQVPFHSMKDVFMWAMCLGYQRGERRPITGKRKLIFRWKQFEKEVDRPLLKAFAIASTDNITVLSDRDQILTIAEEYANAGIHDLKATLMDNHGKPLWELVNMVSSMGTE